MIDWPFYYTFPIISALVFALSSLFIKRGLELGAGATRALFISNTIFFLYFLPYFFISNEPIPMPLLWAPILAGVVAFFGALFGVLALKHGDVSVATPLLGSKVLFVALLSSWILTDPIPLSWWIGAVLAMIAVALLGYAPIGKRRAMALTVILSLGSALSFALMDVIFAGWAQEFGFKKFVSIQQFVLLICSFPLIYYFQAPLREIPKAAWKWLLISSVLICSQFFLLNWTIAHYGKPTLINILYSSRGLWSVILVWLLGRYLLSAEFKTGKGILFRRLVGALLLVGAVAVVLVY